MRNILAIAQKELKAYFADVAVHRTRERLEAELRRLPFEPYAPVRGQMHNILREVNRRRKLARYDLVPASAIRVRRHVVSPFESAPVYGLGEAA